MDAEQMSELKQYFHNVDESAAELICKVIESLDTTQQRNYETLEPGLTDSLKRRVKSSGLGKQLVAAYDTFHRVLGNESIPRQREYRHQKFPGLERDEIVDTIEQMKPLLDINAVSIEKVPLTNDTCYLRLE